ncbi:MAG TPA: hypothetical protein VLT36_16300, partial [Candidatus Dormibacteraeota bacterium]|nr:hypothetical protein [Candidatus Dormibacteraeota bacterium]
RERKWVGSHVAQVDHPSRNLKEHKFSAARINRPNPDPIVVIRVSEALAYSAPDAEQFAVFSRLATNSDHLIRTAAGYRLQDFAPANATNAPSSNPPVFWLGPHSR